MTEDIQEVLSFLIETAIEGEQQEFKLISSPNEYFRCRYRKQSLKAIIKVLTSCSKRLLKSYCSAIESGTQDVTKLLAYSTMVKTTNFYTKDLRTIEKMLGEYEIYLMSGNQLDFVFWKKRKEDDLVDYRSIL